MFKRRYQIDRNEEGVWRKKVKLKDVMVCLGGSKQES